MSNGDEYKTGLEELLFALAINQDNAREDFRSEDRRGALLDKFDLTDAQKEAITADKTRIRARWSLVVDYDDPVVDPKVEVTWKVPPIALPPIAPPPIAD